MKILSVRSGRQNPCFAIHIFNPQRTLFRLRLSITGKQQRWAANRTTFQSYFTNRVFREHILGAIVISRKKAQIGILILCMLVMVTGVFAGRGRPHLDTSLGFNILLSDNNTLLRGVSLSWDGGDPYGSLAKVMPTQTQLDALSNEYGLNTLHLYLEGDSTGNTSAIGYNAADCDILVQRCAAAGLYLIITIGCNGENGQMNLAWSQDFWEFYGPRYKDETHVIYEAHNEPALWTPSNWTTADWNNQIALYNTIRAAAPDTFILLGSFMGFAGDPRWGANYLAANGVSWSNAGFAHHGYENGDGIENAINLLKNTSYPALLCTEFWPGDTYNTDKTPTGRYNSMYESHFNGWMQFMWLGADDSKLTEFKTKINAAGTVWTPDVATCNWPAKGSPNIPAHGSSVGIFDRGADAFVRVDASSDLIADLPTYTGSQGDQFIVEDAGDNMISLKADNGLYVSAGSQSDSLTANKATAGVNEKFIWYELPNGEVALRAFGGGGHLIRAAASGVIFPNADDALDIASNYVFVDGSIPAGPPPPKLPYYGAPMSLPGTIEAEDFDTGGEGVSYHDTSLDNQGGSYRPAERVDIENCTEGGFNVGWTQPGEWMKYTVDVTPAGDYRITSRVARGTGGTGRFHIEIDGVDVTGPISVSYTGGWQSWVNKISDVTLGSGVQVMEVVIEAGDVNINRFEFELLQAANTPPTFTVDPIDMPNAFEGIAYSNTLAGSATDVDPGDTLTYSLVSGPAWLNVDTNGTLSGTPGAGDVGAVPITVKVEDNALAFDTAVLNITVESAPVPPAITIQMSGSTLEVLWPSSATAYSLYGTTNLLPPVVWSAVTNTPILQGDSWIVIIPAPEMSQYFRLEAP
jgi:hypothetical protein